MSLRDLYSYLRLAGHANAIVITDSVVFTGGCGSEGVVAGLIKPYARK